MFIFDVTIIEYIIMDLSILKYLDMITLFSTFWVYMGAKKEGREQVYSNLREDLYGILRTDITHLWLNGTHFLWLTIS